MQKAVTNVSLVCKGFRLCFFFGMTNVCCCMQREKCTTKIVQNIIKVYVKTQCTVIKNKIKTKSTKELIMKH